MNVTNLELSKQLYELSGWYTDRRWYQVPEDNGTTSHEVVKTGEIVYRNGVSVGGVISPAYDCGYLLRKLPTHTQVRTYYGYHHEPEFSQDECGSYAYYDYAQGRYNLYGATPEDALCLLAIKLFEQGVLTKEK